MIYFKKASLMTNRLDGCNVSQAEYLGCFKDAIEGSRVFEWPSNPRFNGPPTVNNVTECIDICIGQGMGYMGLQYGKECWCSMGNEYFMSQERDPNTQFDGRWPCGMDQYGTDEYDDYGCFGGPLTNCVYDLSANFPYHQVPGRIYKIQGLCYRALTNCYGCMDCPECYPEALQPMECGYECPNISLAMVEPTTFQTTVSDSFICFEGWDKYSDLNGFWKWDLCELKYVNDDEDWLLFWNDTDSNFSHWKMEYIGEAQTYSDNYCICHIESISMSVSHNIEFCTGIWKCWNTTEWVHYPQASIYYEVCATQNADGNETFSTYSPTSSTGMISTDFSIFSDSEYLCALFTY